MQFARVFVLSALLAFGATASQDKTITRVVKLLESMLEKSKEDGDSERELYAKFKCYCDNNDEQKTESIATLGQQIGLLESKIESLQGSNGELSTQCAKLRTDMTANEEARASAENIRGKEKANFVAEETDLTGAIGQMSEAIDTLAEIGADQDLEGAASDNKKFMAGFGSSKLLKLKSSVKQALLAASVFMGPKAKTNIDSFLQAPFTGSYSAQSGKIVGILKDMKDTFANNLASARSAEKVSEEAFQKFMKTKTDAYDSMSAVYERKQAKLGGNDGDLASKKEQLSQAEIQKAEDEDFLGKLKAMCAEKAKDYNARNQARTNEHAAISEAIAILNSDAAYTTFGKVDATSTGGTGASFLQLRAVRAHDTRSESVRLQAQRLLRKAGQKSMRLLRIAALLEAENPFAKVLEEIEKMITLIQTEGKADKEQLDWCNEERTTNDAEHEKKVSEIDGLTGDISELDISIDDPESGMKAQISETESLLEENHQNQITETKERAADNMAYQKDIGHLVEAQGLLERALKVLSTYYDAIAEAAEANALLQQQDDPTPPSTWENDSYGGQSGAGGNSAIAMIQYILDSTRTEESAAHAAEEEEQHQFEDSMQALKDGQAEMETSLADLRSSLAAAEKELIEKKESLETTIKDKEAIEEYLKKIKPGCDFITLNFDEREANRATEKGALENAIELLKGTPAFQAAMRAAHEESLGKCKEICGPSEAHADCKACLADVTVPAYCAGHAGTEGC